jgi:hypothetical protein
MPGSSGITSNLNDPNVVAVPSQGLPDTGGGGQHGPQHNEVFHVNPDDPWYEKAAKGAVNFPGNMMSGVGGAVADTAFGAVQDAPSLAPVGMLAKAVAPGAVNALEKKVGELKDQFGGVGDTGVAGMVGYGGESLLEFLAGDEAIKGLSLGKRLEAMTGITKLLEQSPRTMSAVKVGASVAKILEQAGVNTLTASTLVGLQTFLRSGDAKKSLQDAIHTAEIAGPFSVASSAAGEVAGAIGKGANAYRGLTEAAGSAAPKEQVAAEMAEKLNSAEKQMHNEYEAGFQDIADRTQGQTITSTETPLAHAAQTGLHNPTPGVSPLEASLDKKIGNGLDPRVRELLQELSTGVSADEQKAFEDAQRAASRPTGTGVIGPDGQEITRAAEQPDAPVPHEYTGEELVRFRQKIRTLSEDFDYGNINSRVLRSLISSYGDHISPMDETLGQIASQTGDDSLVNDYMRMRRTYMEKHSVFENNKVIDNLRQGKVGDAAQGFVNMTREGTANPTTGKAAINIRDLRTVLGTDGVHAFGKEVFGTVLRDSMDKIGDNFVVNPDKFLRTMERFDPDTLNQLIDWGDVNNGLAALKGDAQSAALLQKLTRLGVMGGVGTVAGAMPHVGLGTLVGMTAGEGGGMGGIAQGRRMLDWIANNPRMWKTWARIGRASESPTAGRVASTVRYGAGKGLSAVLDQAQQDQDQQKKSTERDVYSGLNSSLGGTQ